MALANAPAARNTNEVVNALVYDSNGKRIQSRAYGSILFLSISFGELARKSLEPDSPDFRSKFMIENVSQIRQSCVTAQKQINSDYFLRPCSCQNVKNSVRMNTKTQLSSCLLLLTVICMSVNLTP